MFKKKLLFQAPVSKHMQSLFRCFEDESLTVLLQLIKTNFANKSTCTGKIHFFAETKFMILQSFLQDYFAKK